jgi:hypothetical protein
MAFWREEKPFWAALLKIQVSTQQIQYLLLQQEPLV